MKKYSIKINGMEYSVSINSVKDEIVNVTINNVEYQAEVEGISINPTRMTTQKTQLPPSEMQGEAPIVKKADLTGSGYPLRSPLPGSIQSIKVKEGDAVKAGQVLLTLEAMKMENNIEADKDGVIEKINVAPGEAVLEGHILLTIK